MLIIIIKTKKSCADDGRQRFNALSWTVLWWIRSLVSGTLGIRCDPTLDVTQVHHRAPYIHTFTPADNLA